MAEWKLKRFWKDAHVVPTDGGYRIELDERPVKTPAKAPLIVPAKRLAQEIAAEWNAVDEVIDPGAMPCTRSANAAIDKMTHQHGEVADMLAAYGDADLICYRAQAPEDLVERQTQGWDPLLDWAERALQARLKPVSGVMHVPQDPRVLQVLSRHVHALDVFALTAFHDLVSLSGSLVIGFAALHEIQDAEDLWLLSRIDEIWQAEKWGHDEDAAQMAARKESDFLHAQRFYKLSRLSV